MDHHDHIESPSVERRKLIEKRMEMIANLFNQMNEEENQEKDSKADNKHKRISDCNGIMTLRRIGRFVNVLQRMFT